MKKTLPGALLLCLLTACSQDPAQAKGPTGAMEQAGDPMSGLPPDANPNQGDPTPHGKLPPEVLFEIAQKHMNEGQVDAAIGHLDLAIQQLPSDATLFATRATAHSALGQHAKALADIERAVKLDPHNPGLLTNRGQILRGFGRDADALVDFDSALELETSYYPALFNRGVLHFNQAENQAALQDFTAAIASQPETAGAYYNRAFVQETLGDLDAARADMRAFLERTKSIDLADLAKAHLATWDSQ